VTPTPTWYTLTERRTLGRALRAGGWFATLKALAKGDIGTVARESKGSVTLTPDGAVHERLGLVASVSGNHLPKPRPGDLQCLSVRVSPADRSRWEHAAAERGVTLAEWVRRACEVQLGN
jgi:hypothetical protein